MGEDLRCFRSAFRAVYEFVLDVGAEARFCLPP
jgi:hypothetical protein